MNKRTMVIGLSVIILIGGLAFLLISIIDQGPIVGGPCSYQIVNYPAKVARIDTVSENELVISFIDETNEFQDTLVYNKRLEFDEIEHLNLSLETVLIYEQHEIIEGACNPSYGKIVLKEFEE